MSSRPYNTVYIRRQWELIERQRNQHWTIFLIKNKIQFSEWAFTSIFRNPRIIFHDASDAVIFIIKISTLFATKINRIRWTLLRIARFVFDAIANAIFSTICRNGWITFTSRWLYSTAACSTTWIETEIADRKAKLREESTSYMSSCLLSKWTPSSINFLNSMPITMNTFPALTPMILTAFGTISPWHVLSSTTLCIVITTTPESSTCWLNNGQIICHHRNYGESPISDLPCTNRLSIPDRTPIYIVHQHWISHQLNVY